jgi:hypothetical protein
LVDDSISKFQNECCKACRVMSELTLTTALSTSLMIHALRMEGAESQIGPHALGDALRHMATGTKAA